MKKTAARWVLLTLVTVAVTVGLTLLGVPSAALFAALVVGIVLALCSLAPTKVPRRAGQAAQAVLGVYIGTMVHEDSIDALGPHWPIVLGVVVATLLISIVAGALLGMRRDISSLTGALALVAGGASGLVAIARELGGDDRVVAVVQYLRVGLVTATMPIVVLFIFHPDRSHPSAQVSETGSAPWYLSVGLIVAIALVGVTLGKLIHLPGAGLLGPMAVTVALEVTGNSFGLTVPQVLVQVGYVLIGWQAGVAFTRESLRAVGRAMPLALGLIAALTVATAGLGMLLSHVTGMTPLEGYLATSPGGVYAVLATAVETGSNVTFIVAAQVLRILVMLFAAPLMARGLVKLAQRLPGHPGREIRHQRHRQHLRALGAGGDRLVHCRHPHQIGAEGAQHADLRRRLVVRTRQPRVDALGQGRVDLARQRAQRRRVRIHQVDELRTDQRGARRQIEMVADQHRLPDLEITAQPTCGIGQHHRRRTGRAGRTYRVHHMREVVTFIGVDAAHQHQHPMLTEGQRQRPAAVPGCRRRGETGQLGHRNDGRRLAQRIHRGRPAGPQDHRDVVVVDTGAVGDGGGGLGCGKSHACEPSDPTPGRDPASSVRYCWDAQCHRVLECRGCRPAPAR
jgi:uncharacterized protein